jgi:hypothetical protein
MRRLLLSLLFCLILSTLAAEKLDLAIKYLGLKVVDVQIEDNGARIFTQAQAVGLANFAAKMNNRYLSYYTDNYLTQKYVKEIQQKDYFEQREIIYHRDSALAFRKDFSHDLFTYAIDPESRDFFAALFYLRTLPDLKQGFIWLDANKSIWKAHYQLLGKEEIKTKIGLISALKIELSFEKISSDKKENSDMLTNNLVDEEKKLLFWFSDDSNRIPLRAEFVMKPFAVYWELTDYEK